MIAFDYLIILGLVGFYLYDSAKLCFYNEFYLLNGFTAKFKSQMLVNHVSIFKKFLIIPQPFCPHYLCFKVRWQLTHHQDQQQVADNEIGAILNLQKILKPLQPMIYLNTVLTLVLLPIALIYKSSYLYLAILILSIYAINLINITWIFVRRKQLHLSNLKFSYLLIDALLCPPFALNLLQKISLNYDFKTDAITLSQHLLQADDFQALLSQTIADIELLKNNHDSEQVVIEQLTLKQNYLTNLLSPP